jgi:hypothetical protein
VTEDEIREAIKASEGKPGINDLIYQGNPQQVGNGEAIDCPACDEEWIKKQQLEDDQADWLQIYCAVIPVLEDGVNAITITDRFFDGYKKHWETDNE